MDKPSELVPANANAIEPAKLGRPSLFTPELAERIVEELRGGTLLRELGRLDWAPDHSTVWRWMEQREDFRNAVASARKAGASRLADECLPIVDNVDTDSEFGNARVSKAREQVGLRRWLAGCLDRETYGERPPTVAVQVNSQVAVAFGRLGGAQDGE